MVTNLLHSELLKEDEAGRLQFDQHLVEPLAYSEPVLPADARQAIRHMAAMPVQAA